MWNKFLEDYGLPLVFGWIVPIVVLAGVVVLVVRNLSDHFMPNRAAKLLKRHFRPIKLDQLSTSARKFSSRLRPDLQQALEKFFTTQSTVDHFAGVAIGNYYESLNLASVFNNGVGLSAPQYDDIDIGEEQPLRCLRSGLWLVHDDEGKHAVLFGPTCEMSPYGMRSYSTVQVASAEGEAGERFARRLFDSLEQAITQCTTYRRKILSFEQGEDWQGSAGEVKVHKLKTVARDDIVLPPATVELLERNIVRFVAQREQLNARRLSKKKGVLFYGPPGTGKTHCIHYLAGVLADHTTLLISAEQVGLLSEYMTLARLLQPSLVVIEDADLIARNRVSMNSGCEEVLLNKLLNEMDGLRSDSEILFILTTNQPEAIEQALAARPGRIDQAIEFPMPDEPCRQKLIRLYGEGLSLDDTLVESVARKTDGVSASFIKELMRRSTQFQLERDGNGALHVADVDLALDELLFSGGTLNRKLLGSGHEIAGFASN